MRSEIVVGIDYGTTYSGVSWAFNGGKKAIRLITNWPNPAAINASQDKVPSRITYRNGHPEKWGYSVAVEDESVDWVKLLLEPDYKYRSVMAPVQKSMAMLTQMEKTSEKVVADYLRFLWSFTLKDIRRLYDDFEDTCDLRVILTCPAIWTEAAKAKTLRAAANAGLPEGITLVTEPEAAALCVLKDKLEEHRLKLNDVFIVCDAGGGTVDLINYKITSLDPLEYEECAVGDGQPCGAVYLDDAFQKYIRQNVGEAVYSGIKEIYRKQMMDAFEKGIKKTFDGNDQNTYSIDLRDVPDNPAKGINDETMLLKPTMLKTVFDSVIAKVIDMVESQISEIGEKGQTPKAVLLVGGFGDSPYLYHRLSSAFKSRSINVLQVNGSWSAVCKGATLWGLEHSAHAQNMGIAPTIQSRLARCNYGVALGHPFIVGKHLLEDRYVHARTSTFYARDQMTWLLKRGEKVEDGRTITHMASHSCQIGWRDAGTEDWDLTLYYCMANNPPTRLDKALVKKLCTVSCSLDKQKIWVNEKSSKNKESKTKNWRNATFKILIQLKSTTLEFSISYADEIAAHTEAKYVE